MSFSICLLADRPECIAAIADMRWREWGHSPEPEDPAFWLETTSREAGRDRLPVTFVAVESSGDAIGTVGLDEFDLEERRDRSPWITGTIVRSDYRRAGVGRALMECVETWAAEQDIAEVWVGTGAADSFYRRCGWQPIETYTTTVGQRMTVLHKRLTPGGQSEGSDHAGLAQPDHQIPERLDA